MLTRPLLFVGILAACVIVPYLALNEPLAATARNQWQRLTNLGQSFGSADHEEPGEPPSRSSSTEAPPGPPIEHALRFDRTPQWVAACWPRVTTVVGDHQQLGMRVAWISGTRPDDVAGSLTYYFNRHHQLERITFTGLTSEPRRLLAAVVGPFGLKSQPTTHAAHYLSGNPENPTSEVLVSYLPVLVSSDAARRAEISLDLGHADQPVADRPAARDPDVKLLPPGYRRW